jgi:signal transduction histidine kinase
MNVPAILSVVAAVSGASIALLACRISTAPGWGHKRYFALVALCGAVYAMCDVLSFLDLSHAQFLAVMRVQGAIAMAHSACWTLYAFAHLGIRRPRTRATVLALSSILAILWLAPGCMIDDRVTHIYVAWLGTSYNVQTSTPLGAAAFVSASLALLLPLGAYIHATRRGVRGTAFPTAGLAVILACGAYDTVVAELALPVPFVLPLAFLVSLAAMGLSLTSAFVESARELDAMTTTLEQLVGERTRKLLEAESALARAETLAAVGTLSAGVAHEINNPAAAVAANLEYLRLCLGQGNVPPDALACLDESLDANQRIATIVRKLLDSTRSAAASPMSGSASIGRAVAQALATVRSQLGRVTVVVDAPAGLFARADESSLVQVLVNLLVNGAQAVPKGQADGLVRLSARKQDKRITLEVHDNGTGIPPHVRARLFEPFYTTKALGMGTGLGLSVSLGLVRSMGGEIEVDSAPGHTTMRVHVPALSCAEVVHTIAGGGGAAMAPSLALPSARRMSAVSSATMKGKTAR